MKPYNECQKILCKNGYPIVQVGYGEKSPYTKGWPTHDYCKDNPLTGIYKNAEYNIGIKTELCPAIDADCIDKTISKEIKKALSKLLNGSILDRTGQPPKFLIPCQLKGKPFKKTSTGKFSGDNCVEILATGQQFIAFGEHPKGHEYTWVDRSLLDVKLKNLPKLDVALANKIIELCCGIFKKHGLSQVTKSTKAGITRKFKAGITKRLPKKDPILIKLKKLGLIRHESEAGKFEIVCPFHDNHTQTNGDNWKHGAFFTQIGFQDNSLPFYHCLHSGCVDIQFKDLRQYLNITLPQITAMRKEVLK